MSSQLPSKTVLSGLQERATGMCRPEEFMRKPGVFDLQEEKTGARRPGLDRNEEYELRLIVGCRYWANTAQRIDARKNAEAVLAHTLYSDVLAALSGIRHAIYDGDRSAAISRLGELERSLTR